MQVNPVATTQPRAATATETETRLQAVRRAAADASIMQLVEIWRELMHTNRGTGGMAGCTEGPACACACAPRRAAAAWPAGKP